MPPAEATESSAAAAAAAAGVADGADCSAFDSSCDLSHASLLLPCRGNRTLHRHQQHAYSWPSETSLQLLLYPNLPASSLIPRLPLPLTLPPQMHTSAAPIPRSRLLPRSPPPQSRPRRSRCCASRYGQHVQQTRRDYRKSKSAFSIPLTLSVIDYFCILMSPFYR